MTHRTILVGFDGSARAEDALELAALLARAGDARAVVGTVYALPALVEGDQTLARELREQAGRTAAQAAERLQGLAAVARAIEDDTPADGLLRLADEVQADLIVVGSSHRGTLGRVLAGSVPEQLVHAARCPVAVPPYGYTTGDEHALRTIGVAFDGSPESRAALAAAAELARAARAHLTVIGVAGLHASVLAASPFAALQYATYVEQIRKREEALVRETAASITGVTASAEPHLGAPGPTLAELSRELDLLVLGSRAYGLLRRIAVGSVSTRLIREAACPLLVLPRGTRPAALAPGAAAEPAREGRPV